MTQPIPEGYTSVTPCLTLANCADMIETYKKAFDAQELSKMMCPVTGKVMHAELQIGNARIMVQDEFEGCGTNAGKSSSLFIYMPDCDAGMKKAKDAGLKETMPVEDMFWGDRMGALHDACGNQWSIATHVKDMSKEEIEKAAEEWANKMKEQGGDKGSKKAA